jgi:glycine cleavage system aminomethyltransferase T
LYHNETIVMDGEIVGYLTSGMYAHSLGGAIGMGYINRPGINADALAGANFEIEIARTRFSASASLKAFYDPKGERMKV